MTRGLNSHETVGEKVSFPKYSLDLETSSILPGTRLFNSFPTLCVRLQSTSLWYWYDV